MAIAHKKAFSYMSAASRYAGSKPTLRLVFGSQSPFSPEKHHFPPFVRVRSLQFVPSLSW